MVTAGPDGPPPQCPICPRVRRRDRPLCNNHMRRVGQSLFDKYFARAGHHKHACELGNAEAINSTGAALKAVEAELEASAREFDRIRELGLRPRWIAERNRWVNPREHAVDAIEAWHRKHRFGLDPDNDRDVIERMVAELYPIEEAR